jgi:glycosyltransferase involved in cell wall biosynthesis
LLVVGKGELYAELSARARPNVELRGRLDDVELRSLYQRCRALVFPGVEDFGIVPLEAMACGRPVIAYGAGGALETVVDGETGVLFDAQTADSLAQAVERLEEEYGAFNMRRIRTHAERFSEERFEREVRAYLLDRGVDLD